MKISFTDLVFECFNSFPGLKLFVPVSIKLLKKISES